MRALLDAEEPDVDSVMRQAEKIGEVRTEMLKHHLKMMLEIRALLTPRQRKEFVRIHEGEGRGARD